MIPNIQGSRLPNGIRLLLVQRTALPLVHCSFVFRSGANADPTGKAGLATLAAEALDAGTVTRSLADIAEAFDFAGAYYQSSVTHDGTVFTMSTLSSRRDEMAALVADLLRHATYPAAEVDRLRQQRLTSFLQHKDRPARIASSIFFRRVFGDAHPYGIESEGDEHSVNLIARDDVLAFNTAHYTPDQLLVIGVGNITLRDMEDLVMRVLGDWGDGTTHAPIGVPAVPARAPGMSFVDRPGAVQSEIRMGCVGIRRNSPDYHAALILNRILGGQFSSRLNANLREKRGLTYGAWSMFQAFRWEGPFVAGGAFHAEKTDEAVRELTGELAKMREDGITADEHAFAVESLAGAYALAFETSGQVALALQVRELYDMPDDAFTTYLTRLRAVTRDDVLRVARLYLDPSAMTTVIVGNAATTLASLERTVRMPVTLVSPEGEPLTPPSP